MIYPKKSVLTKMFIKKEMIIRQFFFLNNGNNDDGSSGQKAHDLIKTEHSDGIEDLFQIEIVEGEEIYACNVCNEGFEKNNKIKRHIEKDHYEMVLQIRKDMSEEHDDSLDTVSGEEETDGEDDDAFLAKFDQDGNLIY